MADEKKEEDVEPSDDLFDEGNDEDSIVDVLEDEDFEGETK